jgi:hypothetical protein
MEVANIIAHYDTPTITAVERFHRKGPFYQYNFSTASQVCTMKDFEAIMLLHHSKLECWPLQSTSILA